MKLSFRQSVLVLFLILTPLVFSMLPFAIQSIKSPPDRVFMGLHRWSEDYYGYLHTINQGLMGNLQNVSKITTKSHPPAFVHSEYAFLGFIGRVFGLNSVMTYHLSRLILGAIFLLVSFYFFYFIFGTNGRQTAILAGGRRGIRAIFEESSLTPQKIESNPRLTGPAITAFFLAFFIGGFPNLSSIIHYPLSVSSYLSWWVELDAMRRSTILPHYLMGNILFLLTLIFFLVSIKNLKLKIKNLFFCSVLSFLLAFVHPIDFLILISTLGLFLFLKIFLSFIIYHSFKISNLKFKIIPFITVGAAGLLPFLYYRYVFTLPFWRFILAHGTTTQYHIPLFDFVMALGPVFLLGLFGIFLHFAGSPAPSGAGRPQQNFSYIVLLLLSWVLVQTAFFLKLYEVFNFDRLRSMHAPYYIPLAFFAALFLVRLKRIIFIIVITIIIVISFPVSYFSLKNQIYEISDFKSFSSFVYPSQKQYESWEFLRDHTPENSAITTLYEARFLLPSVSGNKIAFGANFDNDPKYGKNLNLIAQIYQSSLTPQTTLTFLKNNRISYLYYGFQEKSLGGDLTKYPFLSKIFDNGEVTIFSVR